MKFLNDFVGVQNLVTQSLLWDDCKERFDNQPLFLFVMSYTSSTASKFDVLVDHFFEF